MGMVQKVLGHGWFDREEAASVPAKPKAEPVSILWEGHPLEWRFVDGNLQLTAASVCEAAGISNVAQAVSRLDDDEKIKGITTNDTLGGRQTVWWLTLPGFFALVGTSRKEDAKRLRRFVNHDLLPSVLKYGCYPPPGQSSDGTPIRSWIKSAARKCGWDRNWQKKRQKIADGNRAADAETFAIGGNGVDCSKRYNAQYVGLFGKDAKRLASELGCRNKESPLNKMADVPLSMCDETSSLVLKKMKDRKITIEDLHAEAMAAGEANRKMVIDYLGAEYVIEPTENQKGAIVLDAVQKQVS